MLINVQDQRIKLLSEHAVFVPRSSSLILSDVHLGKAATFQAQGIPVPEGDDDTDLTRISKLVSQTQARQLIIAGDLLHSPTGVSPALVSKLDTWINHCSAKVVLVRGNHDRRSFAAHPMKSVASLDLDGLHVVHDPDDASDVPSICGHLHPVIHISDKPRTSLRLPCFWISEDRLILPSFGTFTGGHPITPGKNDRVFTALKDRVVELPQKCWK